MKKLFISIIICTIANIIFAQTSFNDVEIITPSTLPILNSSIYEMDETSCLLYGYDYVDSATVERFELECVSFAVRNLAMSKYSVWEEAEYAPVFIEEKITTTDNVEQNLLSALNVVKTDGIPNISFDNGDFLFLTSNDKAVFDASFNTIDYGKLQSANDTSLIKDIIDKGYPVIVYFPICDEYNIANYEERVRPIWGESLATGINRNITNESYTTAVIVGYEKIRIRSRNREEFCFVMYVPNAKLINNNYMLSNIIYVPFCKVAEDIFDYAIVPHSLSPYVSPKEIEGPNYLSCTKTYQVSNLPPTATISWRTESYRIGITSGQNTPTLTIYPIFFASPSNVITQNYAIVNPQLQTPKVVAQITYKGNTLELSKSLEIEESLAPTIQVVNMSLLLPRLNVGKTYTFQITNAELSDDNSLVWNITLPNGTSQYKIGKEVSITPTSGGTLRIDIENLDGCLPTNLSTYTYSVMPLWQMQYNNPASETLNIQIVESQNENSRTLSPDINCYKGSYTLELYDKNTTLVRMMNCQENTPQVQMPISGLISGNYYLRLIIDGQLIDVQQVIIN